MQMITSFTHQGRTLTLSQMPELGKGGGSPFDGVFAGASARSSLQVRAPGAGKITISDLRISSDHAASGEKVVLSAVVQGENIGHIFLEVYYKSKGDGAEHWFGPIRRRYLIAERSHEVSGVHYPRWDVSNTVECSYRPELELLADRENGAAMACFLPQRYHPDPTETDTTVDGQYTFAASGEQRRGVLTLTAAGYLSRAVCFTDTGLFGASPRPVRPAPGDRFEPFISMIQPEDMGEEDLLADAVAVGTGLRRVVEDPLPGIYRVGLLVQDHDGNQIRAGLPLVVG